MYILIILVIIIVVFLLSSNKEKFKSLNGLTRQAEEQYYRCLVDPNSSSCNYYNQVEPKFKVGHLDCNGTKYHLFKQCEPQSNRPNYYYEIKTANNTGVIHKEIEKKHYIMDGNSYNINGLGMCKVYMPNNKIQCRRDHGSLILRPNIFNPYHQKKFIYNNSPYYGFNFNNKPFRRNKLYRSRGIPINDNYDNLVGSVTNNGNEYLLYRSCTYGDYDCRYYTKDQNGFETLIEKVDRDEPIYDGYEFKDANGNVYVYSDAEFGDVYEI